MAERLIRTWALVGLPGRAESDGRTYHFHVGPLDYMPDARAVYLRIPESLSRDAEGRPLYPEQAVWVRAVLQEHGIHAEEVWWSHWRFKTTREARLFERVLQSVGAVTA